jgi:hypothetical protein
VERAAQERLLGEARAALGDASFEAEWRAGRALEVDQGIALARR